MYKTVRQRSAKRELKHVWVSLSDLPGHLSVKRDSKWEKFVSVATWRDKTGDELSDFDFWLDLDAAGQKSEKTFTENLRDSLPNAVLLLDYLCKRLNCGADALQAYFSGHSGFHVLLPYRMPHEAAIDQEDINLAAKKVVKEIASDLKSKWRHTSLIDDGLYSTGRLIRLPGSRHNSGLRKVRLTRAQMDMPLVELEELIRAESLSGSVQVILDWLDQKQNNDVLADWLDSLLPKSSRPEARARRQQGNNPHIQTEMGKWPPCLRSIFELSHDLDWSNIRFNEPKMFLLCQLKAQGIPMYQAIETGKDFAMRYSGLKRSSVAKAREREAEVESAARTIFQGRSSENYDFNVPNRCGAIFAKFPYRKWNPCNSNCPRSNPDLPVPAAGASLSLSKVLGQGLSGNELAVYLTIALNGPFKKLNEIKYSGIKDEDTVSKAVQKLVSRKLVRSDKDGIQALKPVREKFRGKFSV